jgi:hypothetical protein
MGSERSPDLTVLTPQWPRETSCSPQLVVNSRNMPITLVEPDTWAKGFYLLSNEWGNLI